MSTISNRFFIHCIQDGKTVTGDFRVTKPTSQQYNKVTRECIPDWNVAANQPTVYALTRVGGELHPPVMQLSVSGDAESYTTPVWKYNGVTITWSKINGIWVSTNLPGDSGNIHLLQKTLYEVSPGGPKFPAVKFLHNAASENNTDLDILSMDGGVEATGEVIDFHLDQSITLGEYSGVGYYGYIEGDSVITSADPSEAGSTATMNAYLINGSDYVTATAPNYNDWQVVWYAEGVDWDSSDADPLTSIDTTHPTAEHPNYASLEIAASDITDYITIKAEFQIKNSNSSYSTVYSAYWDIDDLVDEEEMYIKYGSSGTKNAYIRPDQSATFEMYIGYRTDPNKFFVQYNTFHLKLLNAEGIPPTLLPTGYSYDPNFLDGSYTDISVDTANHGVSTTAPGIPVQTTSGGATVTSYVPGGRITLSYDYCNSDTGGKGNITGIVIATHTDVS